jgi:hypothetical protein
MKIKKDVDKESFDLAIWGLGYESRSVTGFNKYSSRSNFNFVIGYDTHQDCLYYQKNKVQFKENCNLLIESGNQSSFDSFRSELLEIHKKQPISVILDITVMSRHRLASFICILIDELPIGSSLTVIYCPSKFIKPPVGTSPIRIVGEISEQLSGSLGNLALPSSLVIGLGYEKDKALGIHSFLDSTYAFLFIPKSTENKFYDSVLENNNSLIKYIPKENVFYYDVETPYSTYIALKTLLLEVSAFSRPLLIPLGPKILSALSVIIGKELFPDLAVWRASSEYNEEPVERASSGTEIMFTLEI